MRYPMRSRIPIVLFMLSAAIPKLRSAEVWLRQDSSEYYYSNPGLWPRYHGNGTQLNPFYGDFDAIIQSRSPGDIINLNPGVYYTRGGEPKLDPQPSIWKSNQVLRGAGMASTTIRLGNNERNQIGAWYAVIYGGRTGVGLQVSDLTVDCNTLSNPNLATHLGVRDGVMLYGSNTKVRRVKVVKPYGTAVSVGGSTGNEAFGINLGGLTTNGPVTLTEVNKEISECVVTDVLGNYVSAYLISGSGTVRFNSVTFPVLTYGQHGHEANTTVRKLFAYTAAWAYSAAIMNNSSYGGQKGFWSDTGALKNVYVLDNDFVNVSEGVSFRLTSETHDYFIFAYNFVSINPVAAGNAAMWLQVMAPAYMDWIELSNNVIGYQYDPGTFCSVGLNLHGAGGGIANVGDVYVSSNTIDRRLYKTCWPEPVYSGNLSPAIPQPVVWPPAGPIVNGVPIYCD